MNRSLMPIFVALMMIGVATAGATAVAKSPTTMAPTAESGDVLPGERLSGTIGADNAEFEGEIAERAFGIAVATAATDRAKAKAVSQRLATIEAQINELEERKAELKEAREAGEISEGRYRAEIARLEAERSSAERLANQSVSAAKSLPAPALQAHNIDVDHVNELRNRARELGGPEVAETAREIAGPNVGERPSNPQSDEHGPPTSPGPEDTPAPHDDEDENDDDGDSDDEPGEA